MSVHGSVAALAPAVVAAVAISLSADGTGMAEVTKEALAMAICLAGPLRFAAKRDMLRV